MSGYLAGAAVQRVDVSSTAVLLRLRAPGETRWVIVASGKRGGVGVCAARPWRGVGMPGEAASEAAKKYLRARLEGARVTGFGERLVAFDHAGTARALSAPPGEGQHVVLHEAECTHAAGDEEALLAEGARLAEELGEGALAARRADLARAVARAEARVSRRVAAVRGDLARIGEADAIAGRAALFVAEAARAPRGAAKLTVIDWSSGEPREVELPLDPARSAREQIDAMFRRARRLKQGAIIAAQRLAEAEAAAARLAAVGAEVGEAAAERLEALVASARAAAPRDFALATASQGGPGRGGGTAPSKPYRVFLSADGEPILVGRGAAHNDALTFHVAKPHDLWLHAKNRAGAHVIVPVPKGHSCPADRLVDAAHLAVHFSEAREEGVVEVQHTTRRYLRKPKGSAPGLVVVDREKVIVLRVERDRLTRLLAAEEV